MFVGWHVRLACWDLYPNESKVLLKSSNVTYLWMPSRHHRFLRGGPQSTPTSTASHLYSPSLPIQVLLSFDWESFQAAMLLMDSVLWFYRFVVDTSGSLDGMRYLAESEFEFETYWVGISLIMIIVEEWDTGSVDGVQGYMVHMGKHSSSTVHNARHRSDCVIRDLPRTSRASFCCVGPPGPGFVYFRLLFQWGWSKGYLPNTSGLSGQFKSRILKIR